MSYMEGCWWLVCYRGSGSKIAHDEHRNAPPLPAGERSPCRCECIGMAGEGFLSSKSAPHGSRTAFAVREPPSPLRGEGHKSHRSGLLSRSWQQESLSSVGAQISDQTADVLRRIQQ